MNTRNGGNDSPEGGPALEVGRHEARQHQAHFANELLDALAGRAGGIAARLLKQPRQRRYVILPQRHQLALRQAPHLLRRQFQRSLRAAQPRPPCMHRTFTLDR
jgi:hypothetical protein